MKKVLLLGSLVSLLMFNTSAAWASSQQVEESIGHKTTKAEIGNALKSQTPKIEGEQTKIKIYSVNHSDNSISIDGNVNGLDIALNGTLYNSFTQNEGFQTYVGDLKDSTGNFEVLYFLIKNDTNYYKYALDQKNTSSKFYDLVLKDKQGNILTFESSLDQLNIPDNFKVTTPEKPIPSLDYLWFTKVSTPEETGEEKPEPVITPQSIHSDYVSTPVTYRIWYYGGDKFKENVRGQVNGQITDVGRSGTSAAQVGLTLYESTYRNDVLYSNDTNYTIQYAGLSSQKDFLLEIGLGKNTGVVGEQWSGKYYKYDTLTPAISATVGAGFKAAGLDFDVQLTLEGGTSVQKQTNYTPVWKKTDGTYAKTAIHKFPASSGVWLKNNGDNLNLTSNIATIDSTLTHGVSTTAKFAATFQIFYYSESTTPVTYTDLGPTISYLTNV
jgi:hypothetical protein